MLDQSQVQAETKAADSDSQPASHAHLARALTEQKVVMDKGAQVVVMGYSFSSRAAVSRPQKTRCHEQLRPDNRFCPVCGSQNQSEPPQLVNGLSSKTRLPKYDDNWGVVLPGDLRLGRFKCIPVRDEVLVVVSLLAYEMPFDCSTGTQCRKLLGVKEAVASRTEIKEAVAAAGLPWEECSLQVYALGDLYGWETRAIGIGLEQT